MHTDEEKGSIVKLIEFGNLPHTHSRDLYAHRFLLLLVLRFWGSRKYIIIQSLKEKLCQEIGFI